MPLFKNSSSCGKYVVKAPIAPITTPKDVIRVNSEPIPINDDGPIEPITVNTANAPVIANNKVDNDVANGIAASTFIS